MIESSKLSNILKAESLRVKEAAERTAKAAETQGYGRHPDASQLIDLIRK